MRVVVQGPLTKKSQLMKTNDFVAHVRTRSNHDAVHFVLRVWEMEGSGMERGGGDGGGETEMGREKGT